MDYRTLTAALSVASKKGTNSYAYIIPGAMRINGDAVSVIVRDDTIVCPTGEVKVEAATLKKLITAKKAFTLPSSANEEKGAFCDMVAPDGVNAITFPVTNGLDHVLRAFATDSSRYAIAGALLSPDGIIVSTDGHRLHTAKIPALSQLKRNLILKGNGLELVLKLFKKKGFCRMYQLTDGALFCGDGIVIKVDDLDGNFPPYKDVIPKNNSHKIKVEGALFAAEVKKAAVYTSEESRGVCLLIDGDNCRLYAKSKDMGEYLSPVFNIGGCGEKITWGFSPLYMLDGLSDGENVISFDGRANKPCVISGGDILAVIMPVNLSDTITGIEMKAWGEVQIVDHAANAKKDADDAEKLAILNAALIEEQKKESAKKHAGMDAYRAAYEVGYKDAMDGEVGERNPENKGYTVGFDHGREKAIMILRDKEMEANFAAKKSEWCAKVDRMKISREVHKTVNDQKQIVELFNKNQDICSSEEGNGFLIGRHTWRIVSANPEKVELRRENNEMGGYAGNIKSVRVSGVFTVTLGSGAAIISPVFTSEKVAACSVSSPVACVMPPKQCEACGNDCEKPPHNATVALADGVNREHTVCAACYAGIREVEDDVMCAIPIPFNNQPAPGVITALAAFQPAFPSSEIVYGREFQGYRFLGNEARNNANTFMVENKAWGLLKSSDDEKNCFCAICEDEGRRMGEEVAEISAPVEVFNNPTHFSPLIHGATDAYSPDDNKIRMTFPSRLDAETGVNVVLLTIEAK